ncbi:TPA: hypothetical protein ACH3X2_006667 [Trebouxia sp. C0005]
MRISSHYCGPFLTKSFDLCVTNNSVARCTDDASAGNCAGFQDSCQISECRKQLQEAYIVLPYTVYKGVIWRGVHAMHTCLHMARSYGYDCQLPACPSGPHTHGRCSSKGSRQPLRCKHSAWYQA